MLIFNGLDAKMLCVFIFINLINHFLCTEESAYFSISDNGDQDPSRVDSPKASGFQSPEVILLTDDESDDDFKPAKRTKALPLIYVCLKKKIICI